MDNDTSNKNKRTRKLLITVISILVFVGPYLWSMVRFKSRTYSTIDTIPASPSAIVFGAYVDKNYQLTDVTRERVEAGVRLYHAGKVAHLFISGTNRSNLEADMMTAYAIEQGVKPEDITTDPLGIDTHDTCRHFLEEGNEAILVTQGYHLPRAMLMCERDGISVTGLAANTLDILPQRGSNLLVIWGTRASRFVRQCFHTWTYLLGIYDRYSTEAERLEAQ